MPCGTVVNPAEARDGIFEEKFPFVGAAASVDFDDAAAEAAIFGGERIGEDAHGFDGGGGKTQGGLTGDRIGDAGIVDEGAGLIGLATLDVDEAVGSANNAGEKREGVLEIGVEADDGFEDVGGERGAGGGAGGGIDTVGLSGNGDGFGTFFGSELEIELIGLIGIESDSFGERFETGESDGDFDNRREGRRRMNIGRDRWRWWRVLRWWKILQGNFGVGPDGLRLDRSQW